MRLPQQLHVQGHEDLRLVDQVPKPCSPATVRQGRPNYAARRYESASSEKLETFEGTPKRNSHTLTNRLDRNSLSWFG